MVGVALSLFRDWDLLQTTLIPPLLKLGPARHPAAWAVGTVADAVALALAYRHAHPAADPTDLQVFFSGEPIQGSVVFGLSDLRCLPRNRRTEGFVRRERGWVPDRLVMERILLTDPDGGVDVLAIGGNARTRREARAALRRLRAGGQVVFADRPQDGLMGPGQFEPVDGSTRVFRKIGRAENDVGHPAICTSPDRATTLADHEERMELVEAHYSLARSLARRFSYHGELADDLEQVALLALVKAAGRFTPEKGTSFATFATASILGELKRHFRDRTWMLKVPRSLQETYLEVKRARDELAQTLQTSPTVQQIASHLDITEEAVLSAMEAGDSYWPVSLDAPRRDDEDGVIDIPVTDSRFESSLDRRQLREILPRLERREQLILRRLYFDGWTQRRVAEEIGISQMQVSRLMARSLAKLRAAFAEEV